MARGECITSRPLVATRICIYIYTHIWSYLIICANPVSRTIMWCSATSNSKILGSHGSPCRGPNSWWLGDPPQNPSCRNDNSAMAQNTKQPTECAAVSKIAFRTTAKTQHGTRNWLYGLSPIYNVPVTQCHKPSEKIPVCILQGSCVYSTVYTHSLIQQNAAWIWTNPPCYKMFLGFLMVDQQPMWVTTKWFRKRVAVKNHDSLLNGFWKFHSKFLVYFPGPRS
jgi:hypothetical protein